jgi:molybdopterin/thiamine biosynthesis adenylyltransferase
VNGRRDSLDLRQWRNLVSYLGGIGVEILYVLTLVGIGSLILAGFLVFGR